MSHDVELIGIEINKFKAFQHAKLKIGHHGLVLVEGENVDWSAADSNGVGKTTIADAVTFAIYGKTLPKKNGTEGAKGDQVVNNIEKKNCHVRLDLVVGQDNCRVDRYRLHDEHANKVFLTVNGTPVKGATANDLQEKIEHLIGMDYRAFTTSIVVKEFPFTGSSDGEQKKILDKILGLEWLQDARDEASKRVTALTNKLQVIETKLKTKRENLQDGKEYLAELREKEENFSKTIKERERDIKADIREAKEKLAGYSTDEIDVKLKKVRANIKQLEEDISDRPTLERSLKKAREALADVKSEVNSISIEIATEQRAIEKLENASGTCTECEEEINPAHIKKNIQKHEVCVKELRAKREALVEIRDKAQQKVTDIEAELQAIDDDRDTLDRLKDKERDLRSESDLIREKMSNLKETIESLTDGLRKLDEEESPYGDLIEKTRAAQLELSEAIDALTDEERELHTDLKDHEFLETAFGMGGVRSFILDDVAHDLNLAVKSYARALTDGKIRVRFMTHGTTKEGKGREKFSVKVENLLGGDTYDDNSDGEQKRVDACVMLALNYLARTRQNRRIRFMFLDEFLDGLDKTGRDRVIALLKEIAKECRIYVVTHSLDLKPKFNEIIRVRKEGGFSAIL